MILHSTLGCPHWSHLRKFLRFSFYIPFFCLLAVLQSAIDHLISSRLELAVDLYGNASEFSLPLR